MSWLYIPPETLPGQQTRSSACRSAPEPVESTSGLPLPSPHSVMQASPAGQRDIALCVTSSGKVTLRPLSWRGWKTRPWITRLSGTTLPASMAALGAERWISSLAVIRANHSQSLANVKGWKIPAIYGHTSRASSVSANPNGCFWKMSPITSTSDIARSEATWKAWATGLRKDCLRRQKSARRTSASDCSFLPDETNWPTPRASANENRQTRPTPSQLAGKHGMNLATKAAMWPTPQTDSFRTRGGARRGEQGLDRMARDWPTPAARDAKGANSRAHVEVNGTGRRHMDQLANFAVHSRPARKITGDGSDTSDQRRTLNPLFVEALMGWPIGWTGFGFVATAWCPWLQRMRSEFLRLGSMMMDEGAMQ